MQKIFVTSTGTGIGKTLFSNGIVKYFKVQNESIKYIKPIISGFNYEDKKNDIYLNFKATGQDYNIKNIDKYCLYKFTEAISPDQAAELNGVGIDFSNLVNFCNAEYFCKNLLIEGAGGLYVPISKNKTLFDLIKSVNSDLNILVVGSYLGCLSHTISAIKNFEAEGINIDLLVITENLSSNNDSFIPLNQTLQSLKNFFTGNILELKHKEGNFEDVTNYISQEISKVENVFKK